MDVVELKASERQDTGKGPARELRRKGLIPAVFYGPETAPILLTVSASDLKTMFQESESEHVIVNLTIQNGGTQTRTAIVKEVQTSPVTSRFVHVDFLEISLEKKIAVKVQVELVGKCKGVDNGGVLQLIRHQLEVLCLPTDIPAKIEVDVAHLDIGDSLHVEDLQLPEEVKLLYDTNFTVVTVSAPTVEEAAIPEEELGVAEEAAPEAEEEAGDTE